MAYIYIMNTLKTLILCLILVMSAPGHAENWSKTDTMLESSWQAINVIDWGQTLDIADKCRMDRKKTRIDATGVYYDIAGPAFIHERNPLLPRCPTFKQVNDHFIVGALLHFGVSYALQGKYRAAFQWVTIGYGVQIVGSNIRLGLKVRF